MAIDSNLREKLYTLRYFITESETQNALDLLGKMLGEAKASAPTASIVLPATASPLKVKWLVPSGAMPIVGRPFLKDSFRDYLAGIEDAEMKWSPKGITVHHCAEPSLAQRPQGLLEQHMLNLRSFYNGQKGWTAGPHFFVDEDQIWAFSPVTKKGVHAASFNSTHIGVEMLGNYDSESPDSGRGAKVLHMTAIACKTLLRRFGLSVSSINFHRDDPKTDKTCPGRLVSKEKFHSLVQSA